MSSTESGDSFLGAAVKSDPDSLSTFIWPESSRVYSTVERRDGGLTSSSTCALQAARVKHSDRRKHTHTHARTHARA